MSAGFGFSNHDSARRLLWKVANRPVVLVCRIGKQGNWSRVTVFKEFSAPIPARYSALWTGVSSRQRYLGGREREEKDRDTHPYRGRMGRAKAGIVGSTIPASWTAGLRKWYFQLKK